MTKIFVGNLSYRTTDLDLGDLFRTYGNVRSAKVITDRETQRSRGFGFVEMDDDASAKKAMAELNETDFMGRDITVNEAQNKPREGRGGGGGGGGGGREGGGGRRQYDEDRGNRRDRY